MARSRIPEKAHSAQHESFLPPPHTIPPDRQSAPPMCIGSGLSIVGAQRNSAASGAATSGAPFWLFALFEKPGFVSGHDFQSCRTTPDQPLCRKLSFTARQRHFKSPAPVPICRRCQPAAGFLYPEPGALYPAPGIDLLPASIPLSPAARATRWTAVGLLAACLAALLFTTLHWPLLGDASLMHYVAFLMSQGKVPYRDIADMNMPGALMVDFLVIHTFGPGSLAWRLFDFALMGAAILALIEVARPCDWVAGLLAGVLLGAIHASDGIFDAGQRDFVIAVLILIGYAALFRALRRDAPRWMLLFGLVMGAAATIKPTFLLLGPALLAALWWTRHRSQRGSTAFLTFGLTGFLLPLAGTAALLVWLHALHAFLADTRGIMLYHAALARRPIGFLLLHSVAPVLPLVVLGIALVLSDRVRWMTFEGAALGIGLLVGLFSYVAQAKGYPYQRHPLLALVLLIVGIALLRAIRGTPLVRVLGYAGLAFGILYLAPRSVWMASHYDWRNTGILELLGQDLDQLGGPALSGRVQCIDTTGGCYNALYRRRLVQSTGFFYDEFLFNEDRNGVVAANRRAFWGAIQAHPPYLFIVVDGLFPSGNSGFAKLARWPAFAKDLQENYTLYAERRSPHATYWWSRRDPAKAYRLYVRKEPLPPAP